MKSSNLVTISGAVVGTAISIWAGMTVSLMAGIISAIVWLAALVLPLVKKFPVKTTAFFTVGALTVSLVVYFAAPGKESGNDSTAKTPNTTKTTEGKDPEGTIVVDALAGTLTNKGSYSYVQESARGGEAYLADKGATATYKVIAEKKGTYTLKVKSVDDGQNKDGDQNITITIISPNIGTKTLKYIHRTQVTNGWKWFTIGEAELSAGENTVSFVKDADTYVAFTMDEFKFIPNQ